MKIVAFFDYLGFDEDKKDMELIVENFRAEYPDKPISLYVTDNVEDFNNHLFSNCLAIIDYGALNFGQSGLKDSYDNFILNVIDNNPSVTFYFKLTMGKEWYKDDLFDYVNVETIDTTSSLEDWNDIILTNYI
jgi:hypothetical protein